MSARALARYPGASLDRLAAASRDPDWIVAVHAVRALARRAQVEHAEPVLAHGLALAADDLLSTGDVAPGPRLHVFLAALDAASPVARHAAIHEVATDILARLSRVPADTPATRRTSGPTSSPARAATRRRPAAERAGPRAALHFSVANRL